MAGVASPMAGCAPVDHAQVIAERDAVLAKSASAEAGCVTKLLRRRDPFTLAPVTLADIEEAQWVHRGARVEDIWGGEVQSFTRAAQSYPCRLHVCLY